MKTLGGEGFPVAPTERVYTLPKTLGGEGFPVAPTERVYTLPKTLGGEGFPVAPTYDLHRNYICGLDQLNN